MVVPGAYATTSARLDELLQRARSVKPSTSIEPSLQVSELTSGNEPLFGDVPGEKEGLSTALESAAKRVIYANIVRLPRLLPRLRWTLANARRV